VQPSWLDDGTTRNSFGRGPSNDYFIKVWFQFSNWKQLWSKWAITGYWEPLVSSSVVRTSVLVPGVLTSPVVRTAVLVPVVFTNSVVSGHLSGRARHNFGRGLYHESLVLIELLVLDKMAIMWISHRVLLNWEIPIQIFLSETICSIRTKFWWNCHWMVLFQKCVRQFDPSTKMAPTAELSWIFMGISHRVLCWIKFGCGGHLGRRSEMPDTILEGDHPMIISAKFGWDWPSSSSVRPHFTC
jgi:hypothetical protein